MSVYPPPPPSGQSRGDEARGIVGARVSELEEHASLNRDDTGVYEPRRRGWLDRLLGRAGATPAPDPVTPDTGTSRDAWEREAQQRRVDGRGEPTQSS